MKKNTSNKIRLGVFVTIGAVLFIAGLYAIGTRQKLFSNTFRISGLFKDVSGLQVGNNVRFSGITVGIVDNIEIISDSAVQVDMLIEESTPKFIKQDAKATIGSDGLMGNKIVVISPGSGGKKIIQNNGIIQTTIPVNIDDILVKLKVTTDNAASISGDLASITDNIKNGKGAIGKLFMDTVFAENLDQTLVNVKQGTGAFNQNMDAAKHSFLLRGILGGKKKKDRDKEKERKKDDK